MAAGVLGRARRRRSGVHKNDALCQKGVQGCGNAKESEEGVRGRRSTPEMRNLAGGRGGQTSSIPSSLGALGEGFLG